MTDDDWQMPKLIEVVCANTRCALVDPLTPEDPFHLTTPSCSMLMTFIYFLCCNASTSMTLCAHEVVRSSGLATSKMAN
ncbi:hypothetical protein PR003_g1442 [Phytophthora rubi]|uniref:Uncharacterized protein n=1 Tax=Phytophthora rubi TaxID=129364 RepID=A0A6A3P8H1_9STRA|nr:hypothetical protein PR002_g267 [Phytophthora rubi]KAE9052231.1 hypothetical protein PR001_g712 [Phytophthora rubi]KAE9358121.1 hypothetical protein PR003_g1442 [Phytophthora rubi]